MGSKDLQTKINKNKLDIKIDFFYSKDKNKILDFFNNEIDYVQIKGSFFMKETIFFLKEDKIIIVADLIQRHNLNLENYKGKVSKFLMKLDDITGENGGCPRDYKISFYWPLGKRNLAKECFKEVLSWNFDQIFITHGDNVLVDGKKYFIEKLNFLV